MQDIKDDMNALINAHTQRGLSGSPLRWTYLQCPPRCSKLTNRGVLGLYTGGK